MAKRVGDRGVAPVRVLGGRLVEAGAGGHRPADRLVEVGHLQVQRDARAFARLGCDEADFGMLVSQHHHRSGEVEFGVADAAVRHDDRLVAPPGTERVGVPRQRPAGVGHGEVGRHRRGRRSRRGGRHMDGRC